MLQASAGFATLAAMIGVKGEPMNHTPFDPRNDHTAREIRNQLARAFVKLLEPSADLGPIIELAAHLSYRHPQDVYTEYIKDRQHHYAAAKSDINTQKITDDFQLALVLWDHQLFFETHEVLESLWKAATGNRKLMLQALIRAAGYYIHLASGNRAGAGKMAARACEVLGKYRDELPHIPGLDRLIKCLKDQEAEPPKLLE